MMDFLTKLCLTGAAVLFAAWLVLKNRGRIARAADELSAIPFRRHALFLAFVAVAAIYGGAKNGTNAPPQGASQPMLMMGATPAPAPLFSSASVTTNGAWDFSAPPGATVHERWRLRGAADDWFPLSPAGWSFAFGDTSVTNLRVFSRGKSRLPDGTEISPLPATIGVVPEVNWQLLGSNSPSLFWHSLSADGSLLLTWHNVLLHRAATNPVSVQAELRPSGGVTFRYDLSRLASDEPLSGVAPAAGGVSPDVPLSRGVTSVSFKSRDEAFCDEARAAFEESLGGLDPFSFPEGSTNTVLEHLFYSGTTNGAFAFPQTNDSTAVLRVAVTGSGSGDLLVGGSYVPLVGIVHRRGAETQSSLMLPVSKGGTVPMYLRGDSTLSVSFDSGEFAFGELPAIAANRCAGWINFPETRATEPCIHDLGVTTKAVLLPASSGADDLVCTWQGGGDVEVENIPPRSATLTASFDPRQSGGVTYALSHPNRLFGQTEYAQTVRYCPRPGVDEPPFLGYGEEVHYDECVACSGTCVGDCGCPASCGCSCCEHGICPVHSVPYEECESLHPSDYEDAATNAVATLAGVLYIRDPPVVGDQVYLEVTNGHVNCCGCPDHWTNYVGIAYQSHRLRVTDQGGSPFGISGTSCMVDVAGVAPSEAVGDAELAFARDGEIYKRRGYTVLGVGIRRDGVPLSRYNELSPSLGFPMAVCTNQWNAPELRLVTNVGLPTGGVRLELEDATGQFAVWCRDGDGWRKLVDCDSPVADFPMHGWRVVMRGAGCGDSPELPVRLTSSSPGSARLVFRYWNVVAGAFVEDSVSQRVTSLNPPLLVDYNRDGRIDSLDVRLFLSGRVFRYWINECKVEGAVWEEPSLFEGIADALVGLENWRNNHVEGVYDLINLFPVAVSFDPFVNAWGSGVSFKITSESGSDVFSYTLANISHLQAGTIRTAPHVDVNNSALANATLSPLDDEGISFSRAQALAYGANSCLIVAEAKASRSGGMKMTVAVDGQDMYSCELPIRTSPVDDMFRFVSIRGACENTMTEFSGTGEPSNNPDGELAVRDVFFVHGFNVDLDGARNWSREMFKRFWVSGMNARYWGVTWSGDYHALPLVGENFNGLHYHRDVRQALMSAQSFANLVNQHGHDAVVVGHSLGNMVVSEALLKGANASTYIMLDAAVASEAYRPELQADSTEITDRYVPSDWDGYHERTWAANWYTWFTNNVNDARGKTGWAGHFAPLLERQGLSVYNFYSSGDEVFAENSSTPGLTTGVFHWPTLDLEWPFFHLNLELDAFPWQKQEVFKGVNAAGSLSAGWGFHCWTTNIDEQTVWVKYSATDANAMVTDGSIVTNTVFDRGVSAMFNPTISDYDKADILAFHIPAVSSPAGKVLVVGEYTEDGLDFDLNDSIYRANAWGRPKPSGHPAGQLMPWLHSDIKNMAYYYVYPAFTNIVEKGGMK